MTTEKEMENEQELGLFTDAWFTRKFARFKREGRDFMEELGEVVKPVSEAERKEEQLRWKKWGWV